MSRATTEAARLFAQSLRILPCQACPTWAPLTTARCAECGTSPYERVQFTRRHQGASP